MNFFSYNEHPLVYLFQRKLDVEKRIPAEDKNLFSKLPKEFDDYAPFISILKSGKNLQAATKDLNIQIAYQPDIFSEISNYIQRNNGKITNSSDEISLEIRAIEFSFQMFAFACQDNSCIITSMLNQILHFFLFFYKIPQLSKYHKCFSFLFIQMMDNILSASDPSMDEESINMFLEILKIDTLTGKDFYIFCTFIQKMLSAHPDFDFITPTLNLTTSNKYKITENADFTPLLPHLKTHLSKLDLNSMVLFFFIYPQIKKDDKLEYINKIVKSIINEALKNINSSFFNNEKKDKPHELTPNHAKKANSAFYNEDDTYFKDGLKPLPEFLYCTDKELILKALPNFEEDQLMLSNILDFLLEKINKGFTDLKDLINEAFHNNLNVFQNKQKENEYYTTYIIYLYLISKQISFILEYETNPQQNQHLKTISDILIGLINSPLIFNDTETIFIDTLPTFKNLIRNEVISLLLQTKSISPVKKILENLKSDKHFANLLFTEIIGRLYTLIPHDKHVILIEEQLNDIILNKLSRDLSKHNNYVEYDDCRNILLTYIFSILFNSDQAYRFLTNGESSLDSSATDKAPVLSPFIDSVFLAFFFDLSINFLFLNSLSRIISSINNQAITVLNHAIYNVMGICLDSMDEDNNKEPNYSKLILSLLHEVRKAAEVNSIFRQSFGKLTINGSNSPDEPLFVPSLSKLLTNNERSVFDDYMTLCLYCSMENKKFIFESSDIHNISQAVKKVGIRTKDADLFFALANGTITAPIPLSESLYRAPQHIKLIFACFGDSDDFDYFLQTLKESLEKSPKNAFYLTESESKVGGKNNLLTYSNIQTFLTNYLKSENNEYQFSFEAGQKYIFKTDNYKLVFDIFSLICNYLHDGKQLLNIFSYVFEFKNAKPKQDITSNVNSEKWQYITKMIIPKILQQSERIPGYLFKINASTTCCKYDHLSRNIFNSFSISFWLRIDTKIIQTMDQPVQLFRFTDEKHRYLCVDLQYPNMELAFQDITHRVSVNLILNACISNQWHFYCLVFSETPKPTIYSFKDKDLPKKSDFIKIPFEGKNITFEVGGKLSKQPPIDIYSYIGEIRLFSQSLNQHIISEMYEVPFKSSFRKAISSQQNSENSAEQEIISPVFSTNPKICSYAKNIDNDAKIPSLCESIFNDFTLTAINLFCTENLDKSILQNHISIFEFIYTHSIHDPKSEMISNIALLMLKNSHLLDKTVYDSFFSIYMYSFDQCDNEKWFLLITNPFIWLFNKQLSIKSNSDEKSNKQLYQHILLNWSATLSDSCVELFNKIQKNHISLLAHEMFYFFDKLQRSNSIENVNDEQINKTSENQTILQEKDSYDLAFKSMTRFLLKISALQCSIEDINQLLLCTCCSHNPALQNVYLRAIFYSCKNITDIPKAFDVFLYNIIRRSPVPEIIANTIIISSIILGNNVNKYAISIARTLNLNDNGDKAFDLLVNDNTKSYPSLSIIIACYSWFTKYKVNETIETLIQREFNTSIKMWYFYPLLLSLIAENESYGQSLMQIIIRKIINDPPNLIAFIALCEIITPDNNDSSENDTHIKLNSSFHGIIYSIALEIKNTTNQSKASHDFNDSHFLLLSSILLQAISFTNSAAHKQKTTDNDRLKHLPTFCSQLLFNEIMDELKSSKTISNLIEINNIQSISSSLCHKFIGENGLINIINEITNHSPPSYTYTIRDKNRNDNNLISIAYQIVQDRKYTQSHIQNVIKLLTHLKEPKDPQTFSIKSYEILTNDFNVLIPDIIRCRQEIMIKQYEEIKKTINEYLECLQDSAKKLDQTSFDKFNQQVEQRCEEISQKNGIYSEIGLNDFSDEKKANRKDSS